MFGALVSSIKTNVTDAFDLNKGTGYIYVLDWISSKVVVIK